MNHMGNRFTWRDEARPLIAAVIARVGVNDMKAVRRALREAYPWGERERHPYKTWCDEVRRQLGLKPPLGSTAPIPDAPGQQHLFE